MQCPRCKHGSCRRSRRHGLHEYMFSVVGVYPWRCRDCGRRFYAALVPVRHVLYAHCPRCGNFNLERLPRHAETGWLGFPARLLRVPAFRCDPCRRSFHSLRPLRTSPAGAAPSPEASAPAEGEKAL